MKIKKLGALLVSAALCAGMAAPAFAFEGEAAPVEQPVLPEVVEEDVVTVTDETSGALTPEGNLTLVDDYHTDYSDGSGQQFITLVSKSGNTFYLVIDRNAKGQQTVHFMNLVDEADLMALIDANEGGTNAPACTCTDKCAIGAIKTDCEICRTNMSECAGKDPVVEPEPKEPIDEPAEEEPTTNFLLVIILLIAGAGGGAFYWFKIRKPKPKTSGDSDLDDYDYGQDDEDYDEETEIDDADVMSENEEDKG